MFHLFNKVYLDFDFRFNTYSDFMVASEELSSTAYPLTKGRPHAVQPSYEALINNDFGGNVEAFWSYLLQQPNKLIIYVNSISYIQIQIQYWKSIFKTTSLSHIYNMHKLNIKGMHVKSLYYADPDREGARQLLLAAPLLPLKQFRVMFDNITESSTLRTDLNVQLLSFEYLLGDYLSNNDTNHRNAVLERIEYFSWKVLSQQLEEFRGELLNALFDLPVLFPEAGLDIKIDDDSLTIERELANCPMFSWIVDPEFNPGNIKYLKDNYNPAIAKQWVTILNEDPANLTGKQLTIWRVLEKYDQELYRLVDQYAEDPSLMKDYDNPFEQELHDLLQDPLRFGCPYADAISSREKLNILYLSYVWKLAKQHKTMELTHFELKGR